MDGRGLLAPPIRRRGREGGGHREHSPPDAFCSHNLPNKIPPVPGTPFLFWVLEGGLLFGNRSTFLLLKEGDGFPIGHFFFREGFGAGPLFGYGLHKDTGTLLGGGMLAPWRACLLPAEKSSQRGVVFGLHWISRSVAVTPWPWTP